MTGDPPVLDRTALWAALSHMQIEVPEGGRRFEAELARKQGWPLAFAERVAAEYRRFLFLAATAGFEVTPSRSVDEAWHLHLTLPHYGDGLCNRILGRPLDHLPGTGTPEDEERCAGQYGETLALYERVFGGPAPGDVWPRPGLGPEPGPDRGPGLRRTVGLTTGLGGLVAGGAALANGASTLGAALLFAGAFLVLVAFPFEALFARRLGARGGSGSAGCGGTCGGAGDGGGGASGCCASCGGGCGGD
ncbi:MAG TPA: hypothetical protein VF548_13245 [Allosphingosinicella sp.]